MMKTQQRQLDQLKLSNPEYYESVIELLERWPNLYKSIVPIAMKNLAKEKYAERYNPDNVFSVLERMISAGNVPAPGKTKTLTPSIEVFRRRNDDKICLKRGFVVSAPIARFSRDWANVSSAYAGAWQLYPDAKDALLKLSNNEA